MLAKLGSQQGAFENVERAGPILGHPPAGVGSPAPSRGHVLPGVSAEPQTAAPGRVPQEGQGGHPATVFAAQAARLAQEETYSITALARVHPIQGAEPRLQPHQRQLPAILAVCVSRTATCSPCRPAAPSRTTWCCTPSWRPTTTSSAPCGCPASRRS